MIWGAEEMKKKSETRNINYIGGEGLLLDRNTEGVPREKIVLKISSAPDQ